jgi:hypothetical protein
MHSTFCPKELDMEISQRLLCEHIEALSNQELLQMLSEAPSQYRPEALIIAKEECLKQQLSLDSVEAQHTVKDKPESNRVMESIRVGAKTIIEDMGPGSYWAAGAKIVCPNCQHDQFRSQTVLLNTRGLTFLKLDWLNAAATILACSHCSLIQWFKKPPERK